MTLDAGEFIRRFLLHVLPSGFHRIRHYGLFAGALRADNIERARQLLAAATQAQRLVEIERGQEPMSPTGLGGAGRLATFRGLCDRLAQRSAAASGQASDLLMHAGRRRPG